MTEATFNSATACLPETLAGYRARLASLHSEIAAIRLQISTADIRRQTQRQALDADWFHRSKTALRLKHEEAARICARISELNELSELAHRQPSRREGFKDARIAAMRAECDDRRWAALLQHARVLQTGFEGRAVPHG